MRAPIGIKIRNRRKSKGLSQAALARLIGISASYLNLIEGNKRDVGGALLIRIATQLGVDVEAFTGQKEQRLLHDLHELLSDPIVAGLDIAAAEPRELVAQFPTLAFALGRLYRAHIDAHADAETYANRLRSDPLLSKLLHQVLSQVTAMRSSAEILKSTPDLSPDETNRFLDSIDREAHAMTDLARTLIGYFDQSTVTARTVSPAREVDDLIVGENNYFPELEQAADSLRAEVEREGSYGETALRQMLARRFAVRVETGVAARPDSNGFALRYGFDAGQRVMWFRSPVTAATRRFQLARLVAELGHAETIARHTRDARLTSPAAQRLAYRALATYLAGAMTLPYARFLDDAETHRYDIDRLKQIYAASFEQIAHRLVTLRQPGGQGIPFGFLRSDPAGRLTKHFPLPGLPLASSAHACPLWAIYAAFRNPGQIMRQVVAFPDGGRYLFLARTVSRNPAAYSEQPSYASVMLACDILHADRTVYGRELNLGDPALAVPVGPTCRLCVRRECVHRQEEVADAASGDPTVRLPLVPRAFAPDTLA